MERLEQIEKLREKANVSYDEARAVLDEHDGNLLDAIITLERQGKVNPPPGGGAYSNSEPVTLREGKQDERDQSRRRSNDSVSETLDKIGKFFVTLIDKGNSNFLEVWKGRERKVHLPLTVVLLLVIFLPYVSLPLVLIGWVLGYRYRFRGLDFDDDGQ